MGKQGVLHSIDHSSLHSLRHTTTYVNTRTRCIAEAALLLLLLLLLLIVLVVVVVVVVKVFLTHRNKLLAKKEIFLNFYC